MRISPIKAEELLTLIPLVSFVGVVIGLLISSLLNAVWLRLASSWLRIGEFGFNKAFKTAFMSTFVFAALGYAMVLAVWFGIRLGDSRSPQVSWLFLFSPANFFYFAAGSVLGHALIFSHRLPDKDGTPLSFSKASALALVYLGICSAFFVTVWFITMIMLILASGRVGPLAFQG